MTSSQSIQWDATGFVVTWKLRKGNTWYRRLQVLNDDLTAINLTGYTFTAIITSGESSSVALKTFDIITTDYATGFVGFRVTAANATLNAGTYWCYATINDGSGVLPLFRGAVEIKV